METLHTVVIADDDPSLRNILALALDRTGYACLGMAVDGNDALRLARNKKPQAILMDIHMPGMDGLEATERIVRLGTTAIVLLTADTCPELPLRAMNLGAGGYIQKPFKIRHVIATMESAWHYFQTGHRLQGTLHELQESLDTRKWLEKAKGILMDQQNVTEEAAHRVLQKMSQDQGISIKEICRSIIQVKQVLGKPAPRRAA